VLQDLCLAFRALVERLDIQSPMPVHIEAAIGDLSLSEEAALAIYRIAVRAKLKRWLA
jgi:hypothetical protein